MLWRGCRVLRHLQQAPYICISQAPHFPLHPLSPYLPVRCASVVAPKLRTNHSNQNLRIIQPQTQRNAEASSSMQNLSSQELRKKRSLKSNRQYGQHQVNLVQSLDALFARWKEGKYTRKRLLKYAKIYQIRTTLEDREKAFEFAQLMVNTALPQRANRVLMLAHQFGCTFRQNMFEQVAFRLIEAAHWVHIPSLVTLGKRQTGRTTIRLLNWRAWALVELSHFHRLREVLEDFHREDLQPTRRTFHALISGHIRNRNLGKARESLQEMQEMGFPIDASTHALIISSYRSLGPDKSVQRQAFDSIQDLDPKLGTTVLNSLVQLCLDARDLNGALQYLSFFNSPTPEPDLTSKSGVDSIQGGGRSPPGQTSSITPPSPSSVGIQPDVTTFTMVIDYMAQAQDLSRAMYMVQQMKRLGVEPDDGFAAALIRLHFSVGDLPSALAIVAGTCLQNRFAQFNLRHLGLQRPALEPTELIPQGIQPTHHIFHALLQGIQTSHGLDGVASVLRIIRIIGMEPNTETVEIVLAFLGKLHRIRPRDMVRVLKMLSSNIQPSLKLAQLILRLILRDESVRAKNGGWLALQRPWNDSAPDHRTSKYFVPPFDPIAGIALPRRSSYRSLLRPLIKSLTSLRLRSDRETIALRLKFEVIVNRDIQAAKQTFQQMLDRGMHPNEYHYAALMEGFTLSGDMRAAEGMLETAVNNGIPPNVVLYTILISGYARQKDPTLASQAFHRMLSAGITPDIRSIDAVVSAYFAAGALPVARRVLLELWSHIGPIPEQVKGASLKELLRVFRAMNPASTYSVPGDRSGDLMRKKLSWVVRRLKTRKIVKKRRFRTRKFVKGRRFVSRNYISKKGSRR